MLKYIRLISVSESLQEEFQKWMVEDHFKKILKTKQINKVISHIGVSENGFINNLNVYSPESELAWKKYQEEFQPDLITEFKEKWQNEIDNGKIIFKEKFITSEVTRLTLENYTT